MEQALLIYASGALATAWLVAACYGLQKDKPFIVINAAVLWPVVLVLAVLYGFAWLGNFAGALIRGEVEWVNVWDIMDEQEKDND